MKAWPDGTTISVNAVLVGGADSISGPAAARAILDASDFDSGGAKEKLAGQIDYGQVEIGGKLDPADLGQTELRNLLDGAGTPVPVIITLPVTFGTGPWTIEFDAVVTAFGPELSLEDVGAFSSTLDVTGAVTWDNVP